jgi:hypothetical protein
MPSFWTASFHKVRFDRYHRGLTPNPPSPKRLVDLVSNHDMQPIIAVSLSISSVAWLTSF